MLFPKFSKKGYIAIISSIILSAIVIVIALVFSSSNFLGRFETQILESHDVAWRAVEGCLEYARLKLASGSYGGNEDVNIGVYSCHIYPIESGSGTKIIKSKATVNNRTVNLKLTIESANLSTISLEELASF